jgi:predicted Fe-Mo cluster-binding NifX family protein
MRKDVNVKICITTTGKDLDAQVDPVFGRARYFLLVDPETLDVEAVENVPGAHGAGVQAAQTMVSKGVGTLLTGNVGPNAFQGLTAAGIQIHIGAKGTARDAMAAYKSGELQNPTGPTSQGHGG